MKTGLVEIRNDKDGNQHLLLAKKLFNRKALENYNHFIESVKKEKPETIKGELIKNIFITSTMVFKKLELNKMMDKQSKNYVQEMKKILLTTISNDSSISRFKC